MTYLELARKIKSAYKEYGGINKIFNELSDYAEEFIIGYLEAKCGCKRKEYYYGENF